MSAPVDKSSFVISEISNVLKQTLLLGIQGDGLNVNKDDVVLSNPGEQRDQGAKLHVWLYQILPNEFLRNAPTIRVRDDGDDTAEFYPPLALNLLYLLTPNTRNDDTDQKLLGRAIQIFHDNSILRMDSLENDEGRPRAEELHLSLAARTISELAEVWEAMQQPYRLSVCYEVRTARIFSTRRVPGGRVLDRGLQLGPAGTA